MIQLDRRFLLRAGTFGLAALATPGLAAAMGAARGFTHNVASGEPGPHSVMLWTRYLPAGGGSARLHAELSETPDFRHVAGGGTVTAGPDKDHCAKLVVGGLMPGRWYHYRFVAPDGSHSPVGRTRTLPVDVTERFRFGVFSCSNLPYGWFNAYGHAATRDDLDLVIHLGDYFYEYKSGEYPEVGEALAGRVIEPAGETIHLADYRLRYAAYRSDPDLQALHARFPMIALWDDHESANDSWEGGAENHQPETEGPWSARKLAAMRAYREWMPVSEDRWESYEIGNLATIFRPETRLTARTRQLDFKSVLTGQSDPKAALTAFRDGPWQDKSRTLMGAEQEAWLAAGLKNSVGKGTRWQILAQQVIMGSIALAPKTGEWAKAGDERTRSRTQVGLLAASVGLPFNLDQWDGYPAARTRLLRAGLDANADLLVLSGDSHNAWAFDLDLDGTAAAVEFAGQSVTSPGYETYLPGVDPSDLAKVTVEANRQLKWAELGRRGYFTVDLSPDRAIGEFLFMETIRNRSTAIASRRSLAVRRGSRRLDL